MNIAVNEYWILTFSEFAVNYTFHLLKLLEVEMLTPLFLI